MINSKKKEKKLSETILRIGNQLFRSILPCNRLGDKVYSLANFVIRYKRFPTKKHSLDDVLYRIKVSDEILDPLRIFVSDKEFVKLYVKALVGDEFNVPTIKVLHSFEEVQQYKFPDNCCIKPTHASGRIILRKNAELIDYDMIRSWFSTNFYDLTREANYKTLKPKVIVEPLIFDTDNPADYKFHCFKGVPRLVEVHLDRYQDRTITSFDSNWTELGFTDTYKKYDGKIECPKNYNKMLYIASKLSKNFSLVRIDLYTDGESCFVGEITHLDANIDHKWIPPFIGGQSTEDIVSKLIFG